MIPGILELTSRTLYGITSRGVNIYLFRPLNQKLGACVVGCSLKDRSQNILGLIDVEKWEEGKLSRGTLVRTIGKCGDFKAEKEALTYLCSKNVWKKFVDINVPEMRPVLEGHTFNVDPPNCKDIDDAITIQGDYVYITIADVAEWMKVNPEIYAKAKNVCQTLYDNGVPIFPLLPIQEQCSLTPNEKRLGLSLKFKWNGSISEISFEETCLVNNESFTYESIYKSEHATKLQQIASYLAKRDVLDSHEWIQELMIFYNCEVAKLLKEKNKGIFRIQDKPEKLEEYKLLGVDEKYFINKSALYSEIPGLHYGIGELYCHSTSPIRRFVDIVNQMVIKNSEIPDYDLNHINQKSADFKKYEREVFFLDCVQQNKRTVNAIILNDHRIWVPEWKRLITHKTTEAPGTRGSLTYSLIMNESTWKRRMLFRFDALKF